MTRYVVAGFIAFSACLGLLGVKIAKAHSWYEAACCSDKDCAPISDDEVTERDGGFYLKTRNEFIPYKETRQGKDDQFHLCVNQFNGTRLCFYRKYSGS